ncbi:hypothetical protein HRED_08905 [Candidatus Haloredivivus sp. G17]|nr:hypothetical protein HRED_08905 [Candidatus Haloredivivus sp. G17]
MSMIAAVKVRGNVDVPQPIKDTMTNLGLKKEIRWFSLRNLIRLRE